MAHYGGDEKGYTEVVIGIFSVIKEAQIDGYQKDVQMMPAYSRAVFY